MGKTTTRIIVALAVVFVAIAVFETRRQGGRDPAEVVSRQLFPHLDLTAVAAVQVEGAGATLTLRRGEGDQWGVEQRAGYPVDGEKLRQLALGIARLQARDRLTDNPTQYATLGLGDPPENGTVTLQDGAGKALAVLRLGQRKSPKGPAGASGQFVRVDDDPAVYLVREAPAADTTATAWVNRMLLDLAADQMIKVAVTRPKGGFVASRQKPADPLTLETPLPKGRSANSSALGDLGRALVNLTCEDVLAADDPVLADLAFAVSFVGESADGVRYTIAAATKEDRHYLRLTAAAAPGKGPAAVDAKPAGEAPAEAAPAVAKPDPAAAALAFNQRHQGWTYTVPQYTYQRLTKTLEDLLVQPPAKKK